MEKLMRAYEEIKEKAGVSKITPENISIVRKTLSSISLAELAKKYGIKNPRSIRHLESILFRFLKDPTPQQKTVLHYLSKESSAPTSLKAIHKKLGFGTPYSCPGFLSARILEDMGLIQLKFIFKGYQKFSIVSINRQRFQGYWSDIEEWTVLKIRKKEKPIRKKAKKGEQIERAFKIISQELRERREGVSPGIIVVVKEIGMGDFQKRDWSITSRSLGKLRKKLLNMPIKKFISYLEKAMAEEVSAFYFFEILLKLNKGGSLSNG